MRSVRTVLTIAAVAIGSAGCAGLRDSSCGPGAGNGGPEPCDYDCEAKTLLNWAVCKEKNGNGKNGDKQNGNGEKEKNGSGENGKEPKNGADTSLRYPSGLVTPAAFAEQAGTNGNGAPAANGNGNGAGNGNSGEPDTIKTDRPDFTEASTTVGRGRVQLEAGYTYFRDREKDGTLTETHSYPEMLFRIGMFAEWFELRIGQNFLTRREGPVRTSGAMDFYLGSKIALTEQKGIFPESAMILAAFLPTGHREFTGNKILPTASYLYGWDLTDRWSLGGSFVVQKAVDDTTHGFNVYASSLTTGFKWTPQVGSYFEYFGLYPHGAVAAGTKPENYLNGGFTYLLAPNVQFDVRAGFGLNPAATDFFAGSGFAVRY